MADLMHREPPYRGRIQMKKSIASLVFLSSTVLVFAGQKIAPDLNLSNPNAAQDVIVQFNGPVSADQLKQYGGIVKHVFSRLNTAAVKLPAHVIQQLSSDPNVKYISPDRTSKGALDVSTATVNANLVWSYGYTGAGVGVAVIDSGISLKAALNGAHGESIDVSTDSYTWVTYA